MKWNKIEYKQIGIHFSFILEDGFWIYEISFYKNYIGICTSRKISRILFQAFNAAKSCFLPPDEKKELIKKLKIVHGLDD